MIRVDRKLNSTDVLDALTDLFILRGPPEYIIPENGPEFVAQILDDYSRYIIAWKLCTTMKAADVIDTLDLALKAAGCDQAALVTSLGYSATTARPMWQPISPIIIRAKAWITCVGHHTIPELRARSKGGTRP